MKGLRIGLDVGGTLLKGVAVVADNDESLQVISQKEWPSGANESPDRVIQTLLKALSSFQAFGAIQTVGIGCAGSVEPQTGIVRTSPNFASWNRVDLKTPIESKLGVPVRVENDANCAAVGEWKAGAAKGKRNVVMVTLGTGLGGGVILNNALYSGSTGTAAELGHMCLDPHGHFCPCGSRGCFERYCSASAIRELVNRRYSAREVFENESDPICRTAKEQFIFYFQMGLVSIANIFDPDVVVIGGGVAKGLAKYFPRLQEAIQRHAFPAVASHMEIRAAELGNQSGAIGAAFI